jgi:hypothetical protein
MLFGEQEPRSISTANEDGRNSNNCFVVNVFWRAVLTGPLAGAERRAQQGEATSDAGAYLQTCQDRDAVGERAHQGMGARLRT